MGKMVEPQIDASLDSLHPVFRAKLEMLLERMAKAGVPFRPGETNRTKERQGWLFASGRTRPGPKVTEKDGEDGLWPADYEVVSERGKTRRSRHQSRLAADCYPVKPDGRVWIPPAEHEVWKLWAAQAKALGLRSGGAWGDWPHVEWAGPLNQPKNRT